VVLFRRTTRGLELTPEAAAGLGALRGAFLNFEDAVQAMQAGQSSKALTIAAPRDLTAKWLLPRLAAIAAADRDLRFAVVADEALDFTEANLDLAIRWGEGPGGLEGEALESEGFVTVARPDGGADVRIGWPGCPGEDGATPVRVADAGLAIDAASAGLGRADVPQVLAAGDIAAGRVAVLGDPRPSRLGYWLVAPVPQWRQKKVRALVDALSA
jgi:LysR family glycine cleavage system transcriptional activator